MTIEEFQRNVGEKLSSAKENLLGQRAKNGKKKSEDKPPDHGPYKDMGLHLQDEIDITSLGDG